MISAITIDYIKKVERLFVSTEKRKRRQLGNPVQSDEILIANGEGELSLPGPVGV